jgi:CubicO group peptidase (beta-lactamase class C family)
MMERVPARGRPTAGRLFAWLLALAPAGAGADDLQSLLADLERMRVELEVPAFALTLADRDRVIWTGVMGTADRASGRPADGTTMFRIGSVTKLVTALALLIAEADGALSLDSSLRDVVPDAPVENAWEATQPLRIVHLLEHTAGLADLSREEFDVERPLPLREALAWKAADRRTLWPPGLHHSYTNAGAGLAALALEAATGMAYEDFVEQRVFAPLGMDSAGFTPDPQTLGALAKGYDSDGTTVIPYWHMLYRAFGAINLLPAEMAPLIQLLLNRGQFRDLRLLSAAAIDRMERPQTTLAARAGLVYGYGLGNYAWLRRGMLFHGHGGDGDGYLARLGYSTERGLGYFLVINVFRYGDLSRLQRRVEDYIVGDAPRPEPVAHVLSDAALAAIPGDYRPVTQRFPKAANTSREALRIERENGALFLQRAGQRRRLIPVSETLFRFEGETLATSALVRHGGDWYFQGDAGSYRRYTDIDPAQQTRGE